MISSPDSRFKFILSYKDSLTYRVTYKGHEIIQNSPIALELSDRVLGITPTKTQSNQTE
ncbi:MAG: glycoside hydrolase family 97 N-terminal domain-containing protein [Odoribacter splanchnicus]